MSTAEITAYLYGSQLRKNGVPVVAYLNQSWRSIKADLGDADLGAVARLSRERWAQWVRRGWDDAQAESRS